MLALFVLLSIATAQTQTDCTAFCNDYNATCMMLSVNNDIYTTMADCMAECMHFQRDEMCTDGVDATKCASGNSYGCRRYHLNVAMSNTSATNNVTHCPHTTPLSSPTAMLTDTNTLSGTVCKTNVNNTAMNALVMQNGFLADFCNQVISTCSAFLSGLSYASCYQMYSATGGLTDLTTYPNGATHKFPIGTASGATLSCRRYHIQVARGAGAATAHCPHALFGDGQCGTNCETYCAIGKSVCPSQFTDDDATCQANCGKFPDVKDYAVITNKDVVCRMYHLSVAVQNSANNALHCPHTSIKSTTATCGSGAVGTASFSALLIAALALVTKFSS